MTSDVLLLQNEEFALRVSRFGGSLLSATWRGIAFLKPTATAGAATLHFGAEACFPLVPYGNRIGGNGFAFSGRRYELKPNTAADPLCLHGDGWLGAWELLSRSDAHLTLGYFHPESLGSPFVYDAEQQFRLTENAVSISLVVTNRGKQPMPFGLGFHPFFPRTPKTRLRASAKRIWSERVGHLPDTPGPIPIALGFTDGNTLPDQWMNNAYDGWDGTATIDWPELDLSVDVHTEGPFGRFMIYSPNAKADFFCFEPMTHLPNAHNFSGVGGGLVALNPGQSLVATMILIPTVTSSACALDQDR